MRRPIPGPPPGGTRPRRLAAAALYSSFLFFHAALLVATLLVLLGPPPAAAGLARATWTTADGLPAAAVNDIAVGGDGYVWLATFDGLVRFDGARFTVFDAETTPALPTNRFVTVDESPDGAIWACTETGAVVRRDPITGVVRVWSLAPRGGANPLLLTRKGEVWTAAPGGLARFDGSDFVPVPLTGLAEGASAISLTEGLDGAIWVGVSDHFVARLDTSGTRWFRTRDGVHYGTRDVGIGPDGAVWVVTYYAVLRLRGEELLPLEVDEVPWKAAFSGIWPTGPDEAWVATEAGLYRWKDGRVTAEDLADPAFTPRAIEVATDRDGHTWALTARGVVRDRALVLPAPGRQWTDIAPDPAGGVWIGSSEGLLRLKDSAIETLGAARGLPGVYGLGEGADGAVWVGTMEDGLYRLGAEGLQHFNGADGVRRGALTMLEDPEGTVWAGLLDVGLGRLVGGAIEEVPDLPDGTVRLVDRRRDGSLLASIGDTLWERRDGQWSRMVTDPPLPTVPVRAMLETDDALWLATGGAGLLRVEGRRLTRLGRAEGFPSDTIRSLWRSEAGTLWVGTEDRGLVAWRPGQGPSRPLATADGLPDTCVHALVPDGLGALWGSTNEGLFQLDLLDLEAWAAGERDEVNVVRFGAADGMESAEGNGGVSRTGLRTADGRLWFATQAGVVVVEPGRVRAEEARATPHVEAIRVGGAVEPLAGARRLAPHERSFGVDFTALPASTGANQRLWYRLEGVDPDWVDAAGRRTAWYTSVPPGDHAFSVRTRPPGEPGGEARVVLSVLPLFWETELFRGLATLLSVGGIGLVFWARLAAAKRRERVLEARVRERTADLAAEKELAQAAERTIAEQAARLAESDRLKTRFFQDLSHELRTPLTLVIGPLEDVRSGRHGAVGPEVEAQVSLAERNARRLFALVNQLLDLVRLDAGALRLERSPRDLVALVAAVAEVHQPLAGRRGIDLRLELPEDPVLVDFDHRELEKVFANLLGNALKFTPPGGRVAVTLRAGPEEVEVAIRDTGPGIPAEARAKLFERFHSPGESAVQVGSGIGLSLARDLTERHDGRIVVDSAEGEGSTFTVVLPRSRAGSVSQDAPIAAASPAPDFEEGPGGSEATDDRTTVLVVDDHPEVRAWVRGHLSARYRVLEAPDGRAALATARRTLPDLVISDVMMPELDGYGLLRAIRADPELEFVPVILLTARGSDQSRIEGLRRGADAWVTKPFSSEVLLAQVDGLVAQRRLLRERLAPAPPPPEDATLSADERYLRKVKAAIEAKLHDPDFGVEELADAVAQNRAHLFRRVKELTGEAPSTLLRVARLERAAALLARRVGSVGEIAYAVGFKGLSTFSRAFRDHYGLTPTEWSQKLR